MEVVIPLAGTLSYRCAECNEIITNPLCSECLAEHMKVMVQEYDEELAGRIVAVETHGETTCIECGKAMGICAHCFSREIYDLVAENNPRIAPEFLGRFDFDVRRKLFQEKTLAQQKKTGLVRLS